MISSENNNSDNSCISSHSFVSKILHWSFTLLYAYGIFKQVNDISQLEDSNQLKFEAIFAIVFLIIVISRYFYMKRFPTLIGAPESISKVQSNQKIQLQSLSNLIWKLFCKKKRKTFIGWFSRF